MMRLKDSFQSPANRQSKPPGANHRAHSRVRQTVGGDYRPLRRQTRRMPLRPFRDPARRGVTCHLLVSGGSDEAADKCPAFTCRSRHRRDVVATRAVGVGRYCRFARRLCAPGSARARHSEYRELAATGAVRRAAGAAMTAIATLLGWLMACLSTGPLLLALVMLAMLRGRRIDDL